MWFAHQACPENNEVSASPQRHSQVHRENRE